MFSPARVLKIVQLWRSLLLSFIFLIREYPLNLRRSAFYSFRLLNSYGNCKDDFFFFPWRLSAFARDFLFPSLW